MSLRDELQAMVDADLRTRRECAEYDDCPCAYKDCYECGKWHNCDHTPWTAIRELLDRYPAKPKHEARPPHPSTQIGRK